MLASTLLIVYYTLCRRYARRSLYALYGQLPNVPYDSSCQVAMDELKTGENDCEGGLSGHIISTSGARFHFASLAF